MTDETVMLPDDVVADVEQEEPELETIEDVKAAIQTEEESWKQAELQFQAQYQTAMGIHQGTLRVYQQLLRAKERKAAAQNGADTGRRSRKKTS